MAVSPSSPSLCCIKDDPESQSLICIIGVAGEFRRLSSQPLKFQRWRHGRESFWAWISNFIVCSNHLLGTVMIAALLASWGHGRVTWNNKGEISVWIRADLSDNCSIVFKNVSSGIIFLSGRHDFKSSRDGNVWRANDNDSSSGQKGALLYFL